MNKPIVSVIIVTRDRPAELLKAIHSIAQSSLMPNEIIIVDNGSRSRHPINIKLNNIALKQVFLKENLGAAEGRNIGAQNSVGDLLLFMDDDAWIDKKCIFELVTAASKIPGVGLMQPKIYTDNSSNPPVLQGIAHDINLTTGRLTGLGIGERDLGQYGSNRKIPFVGCVWMATRECFEQVGGYDSRFFIPYEDSDFSARVHKSGYSVWYIAKAIVRHPAHKNTFVHPATTIIGITNPKRAYYVSRNKLLFLSKHSPTSSLIFFILCLLPIYTLLHSLLILISRRIDILVLYIKGLGAGLLFVINELVNRLKIKLLAVVEPPVWLLDKRAMSILDVGCGDAVPMRMIKSMRKINWSVGVDLFLPYVNQDKLNSTHNRFLISDVTKMNFKPNSFDAVICFQVIEHLKKPAALKLIKQLESISRYQVILATPIGEMYHPPIDDNDLQLRQSFFTDTELAKLGYKTYIYGWKWLLGENGIAHRVSSPIGRKIIYALTILSTPLMYFWGDYHVYAVKTK